MRKLVKILIVFSLIAILIQPAFAQQKVDVYFFYSKTCSHCEKEAEFLEKLIKETPEIEVHSFEVVHDRANAKLLTKVGDKLGLDIRGVPLLIVGDKAITGFGSDETTGRKIKDIVNDYIVNGCEDVVGSIIGISSAGNECIHGCDQDDAACIHDCGCRADIRGQVETPDTFHIPLLGEIKIKDLSLPLFTILIAAADGFNPCAMWVLLFLINLLLGMKSRRRMWMLGSSFIIASGAVYFLFVFVWLKLFLFVGYIVWVRIVVGLVAIASGGYHLREYWVNRDGTCHVTSDEKRRKVFDELKSIVQEKKFLLAFFGIIVLAAAVNLIELVCSAGFPQTYAHILSQADLAPWQHTSYLLLYILIFMLDDLLVFVIAMKALRVKVVSSRYTRWSSLIGGLLIFILGLLLIFKPGLLALGGV